MTAGSEDGPMAAGLLAQTPVLLMSLAWSSHRPQLADPLFSLKPLFSKTRREEREGKEREEKGGRRRGDGIVIQYLERERERERERGVYTLTDWKNERRESVYACSVFFFFFV